MAVAETGRQPVEYPGVALHKEKEIALEEYFYWPYAG